MVLVLRVWTGVQGMGLKASVFFSPVVHTVPGSRLEGFSL